MKRIALAALCVWTCTACSHVPMPPDDATPEDVVRAYVAAVNAKDCRTAGKLVVGTNSWCGDARLDDLQVTGVTAETREGRPTERVEHVAVQFTLRGGDGSLAPGHTIWGYLLSRSGPHGAWRIYDQGEG